MKKRLYDVATALAALLISGALLFLVSGWVSRVRTGRQIAAAAQAAGVGADTFNIYYFGDSTMVGEPYAPHVSIPKLVERLLEGRLDGRALRSVNLAAVGTDLDYSVERLRLVVEGAARYRPSLCVLYSGHNQFLKFHGPLGARLAGWPSRYASVAARLDRRLEGAGLEERRLFDEPVVSASGRRQAIERFGTEVRTAAAVLQAHGVPGLFSTLASNYAEWEPNRSTSCAGAARDVEALLAEGDRRRASGDCPGAIEAYRDAAVRCPGFAEAHYRSAECHRAVGDVEQAWTEYQRALDEDGMPMRALAAQNAFVRQAAGGVVTVVDALQHLRDNGGGLVGFDLMVDAHHPNVRGYLLMAQLLASAMLRRFEGPDRGLLPLDEHRVRAELGLGPKADFDVAVSRGRWFTRLSTWRYDGSARRERAAQAFRTAMALDPSRHEPYLGLAMVASLGGDARAADEYLARARTIDAREVERYLREAWVRSVLSHGRPPALRPVARN